MATTFAPAPPPQAGPSGDPTAVFGRRVLAGAIDAAVVGVPGFAISSTAFQSYDLSDDPMDGADFCDAYLEQYDGACIHINDTAYFSEAGFDVATLAPLGFALLLYVVIQGVTGWTVGKLLLGLRTVKEDGSVVGLGRALGRWIMWIVDGLPCLALVGLITAGTSTGHRRVGDIVAKTFVVRKEAAGSPIVVPGLTSPNATWTPADPPQPGWGPPGQPSPPAQWGQPGPAAPPQAPAQPGWGAESSWSQPDTPAASTPSAGSEPQWDAARGTYIQWDAAHSKWLQWDDSSRSWTEIPGQ